MILGLRIAQVRVVFEIPSKTIGIVFPSPDVTPPTYLAYVEWFSPIPATRDPKHLMYRVSRSIKDGRRSSGVISLDAVVRSIHLFPRFGHVTHVAPREWDSLTVLDNCMSFYINPFSDLHSYMNFA